MVGALQKLRAQQEGRSYYSITNLLIYIEGVSKNVIAYVILEQPRTAQKFISPPFANVETAISNTSVSSPTVL